jgi:hypothetical protein
LNYTPFCRAVNSFTGIAIRPKLIVPLQIDLAVGGGRYLPRSSANLLVVSTPMWVVTAPRTRRSVTPEAASPPPVMGRGSVHQTSNPIADSGTTCVWDRTGSIRRGV